MAFSGNLSSMGLDQVIAFLAKNSLEGVLTVSTSTASFELFFQSGRILFPYKAKKMESGRLSKNDLDQIRARAAKIRPSDAAPAPKASPETRKRRRKTRRRASGVIRRSALAEILGRAARKNDGPPQKPPSTDSGRLSRDEFEAILNRADEVDRRKVTEEIHGLFLWDQAAFEFKPGPVAPRALKELEETALVLHPHALLMEVARRSDERQRAYPVSPRSQAAEASKHSDTRIVPRVKASEAKATLGQRADKLLSGNLEGIGLAAVLQALHDNQRTGTLMLRSAAQIERIYFYSGDAYVLRLAGPEAEQFAHFLLGKSGTAAITKLARSGLWKGQEAEVHETNLSAAEQREIKNTFRELLFKEATEFSFGLDELPGEFFLPPKNVTKIALQTDRFLMEAITSLTEWDSIRRSIGGSNTVLRFASPEAKLRCVREIADFLTLVDGRLSFDDLTRVSGESRLHVGRIIAGLVEDGRLKVVR